MKLKTSLDIQFAEALSLSEPIATPKTIHDELPITAEAKQTVLGARAAIKNILDGSDPRLLIIMGPCSIHEAKSALEYADKLAELALQVSDRLLLVMRAYFQKPRTILGWNGLIKDPNLDGSNDFNLGLRRARSILLSLNNLGVPCATEFIDPFVPQYIGDLISWAAIGARCAESQTHRELASGLPMPVGIKNSSDGDWKTSLNGVIVARQKHDTFSIDQYGRLVGIHTEGNPSAHLVLRGGKSGPNCSPAHFRALHAELKQFSPKKMVVVDCSHGNSSKDYRNQAVIFENILDQMVEGQNTISGLMLESHLYEGNQSFDTRPLQYGISITDGCIGWQTARDLVMRAHEKVSCVGKGS